MQAQLDAKEAKEASAAVASAFAAEGFAADDFGTEMQNQNKYDAAHQGGGNGDGGSDGRGSEKAAAAAVVPPTTFDVALSTPNRPGKQIDIAGDYEHVVQGVGGATVDLGNATILGRHQVRSAG